jgi:hypothetical protein
VERIRPGLTPDEAVEAFRAACNRRDTLFLTERWLAEKLPPIRAHLSARITEEEALALRDLARMQAKGDAVIGWLRDRAGSWREYSARYVRERDRAHGPKSSRSMLPFPWKDVEESACDEELQKMAAERYGQYRPGPDQMVHCPKCQKPLTWIYFSSPAWTWEQMCGRAGWIGICRTCRVQADFKLTMIN